MSHFVTLIRYTQQGAAKIKDSPARLDAAHRPLLSIGSGGSREHAESSLAARFTMAGSRYVPR